MEQITPKLQVMIDHIHTHTHMHTERQTMVSLPHGWGNSKHYVITFAATADLGFSLEFWSHSLPEFYQLASLLEHVSLLLLLTDSRPCQPTFLSLLDNSLGHDLCLLTSRIFQFILSYSSFKSGSLCSAQSTGCGGVGRGGRAGTCVCTKPCLWITELKWGGKNWRRNQECSVQCWLKKPIHIMSPGQEPSMSCHLKSWKRVGIQMIRPEK